MRPALAMPFHALRAHANELLSEAKQMHQEGSSLFAEDGVNWGDLSAHTVEFWESDTGDVGWRVYVSEASPTSNKLMAFMRDRLRARGFIGVEVLTEW